jgi:hypothetical protein
LIDALPTATSFFGDVLGYDFDLEGSEELAALRELSEGLFYGDHALGRAAAAAAAAAAADLGDNSASGDNRVWLEQQQWMRLLTPKELDVPRDFCVSDARWLGDGIDMEAVVRGAGAGRHGMLQPVSPFPRTSAVLGEFARCPVPTRMLRLVLRAIDAAHAEVNHAASTRDADAESGGRDSLAVAAAAAATATITATADAVGFGVGRGLGTTATATATAGSVAGAAPVPEGGPQTREEGAKNAAAAGRATERKKRRLLEADSLLPVLVAAVVHVDAPRLPEALRRASVFGLEPRGNSGESAYYLIALQSALTYVCRVTQTDEQLELQRKRVQRLAVLQMRHAEVKRMRVWIAAREQEGVDPERVSLIAYLEDTEDRVKVMGTPADIFLRENDEAWGLSASWESAVGLVRRGQ